MSEEVKQLGRPIFSGVHPLMLITCIGVAALYTPTFFKLFSFGWRQTDYSHGPLIGLVFLWLVWKSDILKSRLPQEERLHPGYLAIFLSGLILYVLGVTTKVLMFETASLIPVLLGASGFLYGADAVRKLLVPVVFLIFLVPPPLFLIDVITSPLKKLVAAASEPILATLGYPVSRSGVLIFIGDYSIVIGDACSGLRSLVSLMAVGALYAWPKKLSMTKKTILFISVIPISIAANIVRLVLLALITYYIGDSAGQRFFHDYSGFVLFMFSLVSLIIVDVLLDGRDATEAQA